MMRRHVLAAIAATAVAAAACGGGGGGGSSSSPVVPPGAVSPSTAPASGLRTLGVSFGGTNTLAAQRSKLDLNQTPVTVTLNGAVVGAGTIDQSGKAKITLKSVVPAGATLQIVAGKLTATVVLAMSAAATAVRVWVNSDGTLTVTAAADPNNTGVVTPDEDEQQDVHEDMNGNVLDIDNGQGNVLPANLPFTLANTCSTITLTPTSAADASVEFEEKTDDNDNNPSDAKVHFEGPFTAALHFPLIGGSTRIHVQVFDAAHKQLSEVKAPITAFSIGATGTCATPTPGPAAPTATPTATAGPTAGPTTPAPTPTATGTPDDRVSPRPSPTGTASPTPH